MIFTEVIRPYGNKQLENACQPSYFLVGWFQAIL